MNKWTNLQLYIYRLGTYFSKASLNGFHNFYPFLVEVVLCHEPKPEKSRFQTPQKWTLEPWLKPTFDMQIFTCTFWVKRFVTGDVLCFRYLDFYFRHWESTSITRQLTSPASNKSQDLNKVPLLLQNLSPHKSITSPLYLAKGEANIVGWIGLVLTIPTFLFFLVPPLRQHDLRFKDTWHSWRTRLLRPLPPQYVRQHICKCTNSFFAYDRSNHAQTTAMAVELDNMQTTLWT